MARTARIGIRLTEKERGEIQEAVTRLEYTGPSAFIRQAIRSELGGTSAAAAHVEDRMAATLERVLRDIARVARGQQALFAVLDAFVKVFLTCVPEPPPEGMPQSVARARDRYSRFVKAAGQGMVGDGLAVMKDLLNHVD